jgi:uncharacterized membrane protein YkoI
MATRRRRTARVTGDVERRNLRPRVTRRIETQSPRVTFRFLSSVPCKVLSSERVHMKTSKLCSLVSAVIVLNTLSLGQQTQKKRIQQSDLPPAVQQTVAKEKGALSISGFEQETENGQTVYEAQFSLPGAFHKTDKSVTMDAKGSVIEIEEWISKYALPSAVLQALNAEAANGKIVKYKTITKNGQLVAYEAKVVKDGKKSEVQVGPDGKPLDHEE